MSAPENERVAEFVELLRKLEKEVRETRTFKRRLLPLMGALYHYHQTEAKVSERAEVHREFVERLEKVLDALKGGGK